MRDMACQAEQRKDCFAASERADPAAKDALDRRMAFTNERSE